MSNFKLLTSYTEFVVQEIEILFDDCLRWAWSLGEQSAAYISELMVSLLAKIWKEWHEDGGIDTRDTFVFFFSSLPPLLLILLLATRGNKRGFGSHFFNCGGVGVWGG